MQQLQKMLRQQLNQQAKLRLNIKQMSFRPQVSAVLTLVFIVGLSLFGAIAGQGLAFLGEVNTNNINVRSDATVNSKIICNLNKGDRVDVVLESSEWYKIRLPKKVSVYIKASLAECVEFQEDNTIDRNTCLKAKVSNNRVNIRVSPDESGPIVGVLENGEIVDVRGKDQGWYRIEPTQNSFAWAHRKFFNKVTGKEALVNKNDGKEVVVVAQDRDIILNGRVSPYGMVLWRVATHKLITLENKIYLLKGDKATLNALNRSKVKVAGKIISPPDAKYPLVEVVMIEVAD